MRIFVGNLSYQTTEDQLTELFSEAGQVESATIVTDRDTGRSRGFAFIEMDKDAAAAAIEKFNGVELNGRTINVNEARPRPERSFGGGGGGRGGGYGGGRGQRREPRWELSPRKNIKEEAGSSRPLSIVMVAFCERLLQKRSTYLHSASSLPDNAYRLPLPLVQAHPVECDRQR